jgi:hypothetical protein
MEIKQLIIFYNKSIDYRRVYLQELGRSLSDYDFTTIKTEINTLKMVINDLKKIK